MDGDSGNDGRDEQSYYCLYAERIFDEVSPDEDCQL